jgi:hypothetical protein
VENGRAKLGCETCTGPPVGLNADGGWGGTVALAALRFVFESVYYGKMGSALLLVKESFKGAAKIQEP